MDHEDVQNEGCEGEGQDMRKEEEEKRGGGDGERRLAWDDETRPLLELYVKRRPLWVAAVEGAVQDEDGAAQKEA